MKYINTIVLAGAALAFAGCTSADGPIFASDATKPAGTTAGPSVEEQSRDINNWQISGQNMGQQGVGAAPKESLGVANPYGH